MPGTSSSKHREFVVSTKLRIITPDEVKGAGAREETPNFGTDTKIQMRALQKDRAIPVPKNNLTSYADCARYDAVIGPRVVYPNYTRPGIISSARPPHTQLRSQPREEYSLHDEDLVWLRDQISKPQMPINHPWDTREDSVPSFNGKMSSRESKLDMRRSHSLKGVGDKRDREDNSFYFDHIQGRESPVRWCELTKDGMSRIITLFEGEAFRLGQYNIDPIDYFSPYNAVLIAKDLGYDPLDLKRVYHYWRQRRIDLNKPLMRRYQAPPNVSNDDPNVAFRPRLSDERAIKTRRQSRKTPTIGHDESYRKFHAIYNDLARYLKICKTIAVRERIKLESKVNEMEVRRLELQMDPTMKRLRREVDDRHTECLPHHERILELTNDIPVKTARSHPLFKSLKPHERKMTYINDHCSQLFPPNEMEYEASVQVGRRRFPDVMSGLDSRSYVNSLRRKTSRKMDVDSDGEFMWDTNEFKSLHQDDSISENEVDDVLARCDDYMAYSKEDRRLDATMRRRMHYQVEDKPMSNNAAVKRIGREWKDAVRPSKRRRVDKQFGDTNVLKPCFDGKTPCFTLVSTFKSTRIEHHMERSATIGPIMSEYFTPVAVKSETDPTRASNGGDDEMMVDRKDVKKGTHAKLPPQLSLKKNTRRPHPPLRQNGIPAMVGAPQLPNLGRVSQQNGTGHRPRPVVSHPNHADAPVPHPSRPITGPSHSGTNGNVGRPTTHPKEKNSRSGNSRPAVPVSQNLRPRRGPQKNDGTGSNRSRPRLKNGSHPQPNTRPLGMSSDLPIGNPHSPSLGIRFAKGANKMTGPATARPQTANVSSSNTEPNSIDLTAGSSHQTPPTINPNNSMWGMSRGVVMNGRRGVGGLPPLRLPPHPLRINGLSGVMPGMGQSPGNINQPISLVDDDH